MGLSNRRWLLIYSVLFSHRTVPVPYAVGKTSQLDPCRATRLRDNQLGLARAVCERRRCIRDEMRWQTIVRSLILVVVLC